MSNNGALCLVSKPLINLNGAQVTGEVICGCPQKQICGHAQAVVARQHSVRGLDQSPVTATASKQLAPDTVMDLSDLECFTVS